MCCCFVLGALLSVHPGAQISPKLPIWHAVDRRSRWFYNLPLLTKWATVNFDEDPLPELLLRRRQQLMLFKSPSFSNHGGENAMRLLQHCFQMRKLTIITFSSPPHVNVNAWLRCRIQRRAVYFHAVHHTSRGKKKKKKLTTGFSPITCA